jgi:lipid-binding SYLF domain-containing protein
MTRNSLAHGLLLCIAVLAPLAPAYSQTRDDARLITATAVLQEISDSPDQKVPDWLVQRAYGIAVIPDVIRVAMMFGGRHGNGVMTVRDEAGRFSSPVFLSLTGGSWGLQFGAQATDVILVFATRRSVENFTRGKFTLGASASVAAGPLGRSGEAAAGVDAEIYSYARSRGLFAGIALDGSVLRVETGANRSFYGRDVDAADIFAGKVTTDSESARRFIAAIASRLPPGSPGAAPATAVSSSLPQAPAPAPAAAPAASTPAAPASGTQTFPLEDSKPGGEPR